jgi:hypothetical protein
MRTLLLLSMLLVAASAAAEPAHDLSAAMIGITELTISGGGGIDPTIMRRAFDATIDAADHCYDSVKSRPAKLSATVTLKFRIDNHGAVAKASAVGLPSVNNCIATAIKALVFDTPNNGAMDLTEKLSFQTLPAAAILGSSAPLMGGPFTSLTGTGDTASGVDDTDPYSGHVSVSIGQASAQGDLDKAIIRRYIKRNIMKIEYCYEKQLLNKPGLAGTVQTQFTIGGDGKVISSTAAGVDDDVASCVAEVIQHIEFPEPRSNGVVKVNYPLVFRPGDFHKKP